MRPAFVIAGKDLRERLRDRSAWVIAILAPFGLAAIYSLLLPTGDTRFHADYAFVDMDDSAASAAFLSGPLAALEEAGIASVQVVEDPDAARELIDAGDVDAAAIIPAGFGADVLEARGATVTVIGD